MKLDRDIEVQRQWAEAMWLLDYVSEAVHAEGGNACTLDRILDEIDFLFPGGRENARPAVEWILKRLVREGYVTATERGGETYYAAAW